jgi:hypothetical protein
MGLENAKRLPETTWIHMRRWLSGKCTRENAGEMLQKKSRQARVRKGR